MATTPDLSDHTLREYHNTGTMCVDSTGTTWRHDGNDRWTTITPDSHLSRTVSHIPEGSTILSSTTTTTATYTDTSGTTTIHDLVEPMDLSFLEEVDIDKFPTEQDEVDEVIDEAYQKELDKIGTPGKRSIDDLLASFKVIKGGSKISTIEQLEDESWAEKAWGEAEGL